MTEPARRVDVEVDVLVRVLRLEEEQLGDDQVGDVSSIGVAEEDDAVLEQAGVDVVGPLAAAGLLDDDGNQHVSRSLPLTRFLFHRRPHGDGMAFPHSRSASIKAHSFTKRPSTSSSARSRRRRTAS